MYTAVSVGYASTSMDSDNSDEHLQQSNSQNNNNHQQHSLALATKHLIESNNPLPYQTRPQSTQQQPPLSYSPFARAPSFLPPGQQRPSLHIDPSPLHSLHHHPQHHPHQLAPLIPAPPSLTIPQSHGPPSSGTLATPNSSKPSLLTPHQKKQNHIQSEQKRRANIKRGYEALCENIPALREAIRQEEELASALKNGNGGGTRKRSRTGSMASDTGGNTGGDRIDGRAGPKSENVVLQKTIDHIRSQLDERQRLKERLDRVKKVLPPTHALVADQEKIKDSGSVAPWERAWYGGKNDEEGSDEE